MVVAGGESVTMPTARLVCGEVRRRFPGRSGEVSARSHVDVSVILSLSF